MSKSTLTMFTINETPIFQVSECEPDCNTADFEAPAQLMFTGNGKAA